MTLYRGGCLCGGIRYEYQGEIEEISICHCSQCRKAQGSAHSAVSPLNRAQFHILQGQDLLKAYRSAPDKQRVFCSHCGSPIYSARDSLPDILRLRLGTLDTPLNCPRRYHIFVDSKADWEIIADGLPQYSEHCPDAR